LKLGLVCRQLEHEVRWKPVQVTPHLLIQPFGRNTVERRQLRIRQHALPSQHEDRLRDALDRNSTTTLRSCQRISLSIALAADSQAR